MFQLKLLIAVIVMAGGAGGYLYVQKLQSDLKLSEANNAKLEGGIQDQQAVIKQLKEDFAKIQTINKELEENNKLQNERKKKLKSDMEAKNKEIVQAELMGQLKDKVAKATSPIPKEIQEKKLDDFLNSKFGKNNDLLSRVAALHGSNTRHDNGNIKTGLSMDIDEASGSVDSLIDNVTNMFSKGGMPLSQTPITDGGEDGLHSFLKTLN